MDDYKNIHFLTANYPSLQGLKMIPIGLLLFGLSIWANRVHGPTRDLTLPLALLGVTILSFVLINRYYTQRFGRVQQKRRARNLERAISLVFAVFALAAFWIDTNIDLPIGLLGLVFALAFLGDYVRLTWVVKGRYLLFYPVFAGLILILSLSPLLGLADLWPRLGFNDAVMGILTMVGLSIALAGFWSHRFLVKALPPLREPKHG